MLDVMLAEVRARLGERDPSVVATEVFDELFLEMGEGTFERLAATGFKAVGDRGDLKGLEVPEATRALSLGQEFDPDEFEPVTLHRLAAYGFLALLTEQDWFPI